MVSLGELVLEVGGEGDDDEAGVVVGEVLEGFLMCPVVEAHGLVVLVV